MIEGLQRLVAELTTPPEHQEHDRDIVRVARVRLTWNGAQWTFDEPKGVSTYYLQRKEVQHAG